MIRSLEHARVTHSIEIESPPTLLHIYEFEDRHFVIFGTVDGKVGLLDLDRAHTFDRWLLNHSQNSSSISCIVSYDLTKNGANNLVIGRSDGNIEVYTINILDKIDRPNLVFTYVC